jgi:hypothetical protein
MDNKQVKTEQDILNLLPGLKGMAFQGKFFQKKPRPNTSFYKKQLFQGKREMFRG